MKPWEVWQWEFRAFDSPTETVHPQASTHSFKKGSRRAPCQ